MMPQPQRNSGFTLVELLAVAIVILLLTGLMIGVAGYVQKKMAVTATKAQITALSTALESYKADWGYYPPTAPARISATGIAESTNNWILYRALSGAGGGKKYLRFAASQLRVSIASGGTNYTATGGLTNIVDPWGTSFNYYCSPTTPFTNMQPCGVGLTLNVGYTLGGQANAGSFDLWSYGPDHFTCVPGASYMLWGICNTYPWYNTMWTNRSSSVDDITNFGR